MIQKLLLNTQMIWMVFITEECNPNKNQKILIAIYDIIADIYA